MEPKSSRLQLAIALIAIAGTLGAAVLSNWDKLFSNPSTRQPQPAQTSSGTASPNIGTVQGDVSINVDSSTPSVKVPNFSKEDANLTDLEAFEKFVEKYRGKLVQITISIPDKQSRIIDGQQKYFELASSECDSTTFSDCRTSTLILKGGDYELGWYKGNNILSGFFVVDENVEMHQGPYYGIKGVQRESVLLQTQR